MQTISASEASKLIKEGAAVIDIREPLEFAAEHITGSVNVPLSSISMGGSKLPKVKRAVFHCKLGSRTRNSVTLLETLPITEKYCLEGGIEAWKQAKLPVEKEKGAVIDIMRQVQIAAGSFVLLGVIGSIAVNPNFVWLAGFVGAGLLFAGITGWCGMSKFFAQLTFNKR